MASDMSKGWVRQEKDILLDSAADQVQRGGFMELQ